MLKNSDVSTVMHRVRAGMARTRGDAAGGVLFVELEQPDRFGIDALRAHSELVVDLPSGSERPVVGPTIEFGKRVFRRLVRWYAKPVAVRQSQLNQSMLGVDALIGQAVDRTESSVNDLLVRVAVLEQTVDRLAAELSRSERAGAPTTFGPTGHTTETEQR